MGDVLLPILRDTKDPHYRYKMPKLTAKVEGSGNGIKTVITNMTTVARALGRPPSYPTKYFGCELGAQVSMNQEFIVNGSHDADKLLNLLYGFIRKFVLCTKCNNPETTLTVVSQAIRQKCAACGHEATINKALHKLTTYIISHPPDASTATSTGSGTSAANGGGQSTNASSSSSSKSSKSSKGDKKSKKNGDKNGNSPTMADSGNDLNVANGGIVNNSNGNDDFGDDDDFAEDELTSTAYAERMKELCDGFSSGMYLSNQKEVANFFHNLVKEKKEAGLLQDVEVQKDLVKQAEKIDLKDKATLVMAELLFTENMLEEIKTYRMLLLRFCHKNLEAQKYLLGGFEKLVGDVYKDQLFPKVLHLLKQFYDSDILVEEAILKWADKKSKKYSGKEMSKKIHEKVAPFITWLREADEEDDDEDDDEEDNKAKEQQTSNGNGQQQQQQRRRSTDDDDEDDDDGIDLEFSHRVSGIQIETIKPAAAAVKAVNADLAQNGSSSSAVDQDDIDIDNI